MISRDTSNFGPEYPQKDVNAQAAYWFALLQSERCTDAQRKAFSHWLNEEPSHRDVFDLISAIYESSEALASDSDVMALRKEALGQGRIMSFHKLWYARAFIGAIAALFIFAVINVTALNPFQGRLKGGVDQIAQTDGRTVDGLVLSTAVGELLTRTLEDGSIVELNTDSEVRVKYDGGQRNLYLLKGQAIFDVAHNKERPFVVFAGDRRVTALGTTFEVRLDKAFAQVTLIEGKVSVDELTLSDEPVPEKNQKSVELSPGQRFIATAEASQVVELATIETDLSWRNGRHIFSDEKISVIVDELNRYTERKIIIGDPKIGDLRASANFKIGSTQSLSAALEATFDLSVAHDSDANRILIDWK